MLDVFDELLRLLEAVDGIAQDPVYHPEGDVLYHSLQVFEVALQESEDPEYWAAALLHDVGKAEQNQGHAEIGAELLEGLVSARVLWLVRHHMHLVYAAKRTRRWLHGTRQLQELEQLRRWDLAGRSPSAWVREPEEALAILAEHPHLFSNCGSSATYYANRALA